MLGRGCLALNRHPGHWVPNKLPGDGVSHLLSHSIVGELRVSCVTPLGEDSGSLHLVFSGLYPMCLFFLMIVLCDISQKCVTKHSCKYECMLRLGCPLSESAAIRVVWGTWHPTLHVEFFNILFTTAFIIVLLKYIL